ncbi:MAG: EAL domain-containing protein [Nitrincola lacisaponensis]|uniref:EAL domain-containing protein n=1 Tax=Nitrincola lacisaponensis TaxID=267850 RepID=UPI003918D27C
MNRRVWLCVLVGVLSVCLSVASAASELKDHSAERVISVLAFQTLAETEARWAPLADYLNQQLPGERFRVQAVHYDALEQVVDAGESDFILTQPSHYVYLSYRNQLSYPLVSLVNTEAGQDSAVFGGVVFVRSDASGIHQLADLKGRTIAVSSTSSLGGYQVQVAELVRQGIKVPEQVRLLVTGQPQQRVVEAVLQGDAQAGFVRTGVLEHLQQQGVVRAGQLHVLEAQLQPDFPLLVSTALYPEWPLVAMPHVDAQLMRQVASTLLSLPHHGEVAQAMHIAGFSFPQDYRVVDQLLQTLELPPFDTPRPLTLDEVYRQWQNMIFMVVAGVALALFYLFFWLLMRNRELLRIQSQLQHSARELDKLMLAVEQSPENIIITDVHGRIEYVNRSFTDNTGYTADDVEGKKPSLLKSGKTPPTVYQTLRDQLSKGQVWQGEFINRRRDGSHYTAQAIIAPVREQNGKITHYLALEQDVTQLRQTEARLHHLAYFDALTGLPNRSLLTDRLRQMIVASERRPHIHALMLLNLDRFKTINDVRGAETGDALLRAVSVRISKLMRDSDSLARMNADEFAILLPDLDGQGEQTSRHALRVSERVHFALMEPFLIQGESYSLQASTGITLFPEIDNESVENVLRRADMALHQAKAAGGNQTLFFEAEMGAVAARNFKVEGELRQAIRQQQLRLYVQPQVDRQQQLRGAEVLVRWQHPEKGLILPGQFIPIAEASDLIVDLSEWVLTEACRIIRQLQDEKRSVRLAVNLSVRHFQRRQFVDWLKALIQDTGINPSDLTLEITESLFIDNLEDVVAKMRALDQLGIWFSIDDFGTGYSSLAYLASLPVHELKIDQSFTRRAPEDHKAAALVETILAVAERMQIAVVAEGVETQEQADFLNRQSQPIILQGYYYGHPQPVSDLIEAADPVKA